MEEGRSVSAGTGRLTRTAAIERFGGCCCGGRVVRDRGKSRIKTVTEAVSAQRLALRALNRPDFRPTKVDIRRLEFWVNILEQTDFAVRRM